jgi:hypothetical protein
MAIVEFVTPRSVAPVALPFPQGEGRSPNFVTVACGVAPELLPADWSGFAPRPPPLLQATAAMTVTAKTAPNLLIRLRTTGASSTCSELPH